MPLTAQQQDQLLSYLQRTIEDHSPYALALTLFGLRQHNLDEIQTLLRDHLPTHQALHLLTSARRAASTPRSIALLDDIIAWWDRS